MAETWGAGRAGPGQRFAGFLEALAPRVGFEPTTSRLTAGCSTTELPRIVVRGHIAIAGAGASVAGALSEASAAPPETAPPRRGSRSPRGAAVSGGAADGAR